MMGWNFVVTDWRMLDSWSHWTTTQAGIFIGDLVFVRDTSLVLIKALNPIVETDICQCLIVSFRSRKNYLDPVGGVRFCLF